MRPSAAVTNGATAELTGTLPRHVAASGSRRWRRCADAARFDEALPDRVDEQAAGGRGACSGRHGGASSTTGLGREVEEHRSRRRRRTRRRRGRGASSGSARRGRPRAPPRTTAPRAGGCGRAAGPGPARTARAAARGFPAPAARSAERGTRSSKRWSSTQIGCAASSGTAMTRLRNRGIRCSRDATSVRASARRNRPRLVEERLTLEHREGADVHRRLEPLEVQEARVERAETVVAAHDLRLRHDRRMRPRRPAAPALLVGRIHRWRARERAATDAQVGPELLGAQREARGARTDGLHEGVVAVARASHAGSRPRPRAGRRWRATPRRRTSRRVGRLEIPEVRRARPARSRRSGHRARRPVVVHVRQVDGRRRTSRAGCRSPPRDAGSRPRRDGRRRRRTRSALLTGDEHRRHDRRCERGPTLLHSSTPRGRNPAAR